MASSASSQRFTRLSTEFHWRKKMDLDLIRKQKNLLEFEIKGERHTFLNLLRSYLLKDAGVEFASYRLEHPMDNDAKFIVRTKDSETAEKALTKACDEIDSDLEEFAKQFKKAIK